MARVITLECSEHEWSWHVHLLPLPLHPLQNTAIRTEFYKALADVERSIMSAEASFDRLSSAKARKAYLPLQKVKFLSCLSL